MEPHWLMVVSWVALGLGFVSVLVILADQFLLGNRQHMWVMNLVHPITALYRGPVWLWAYIRHGRESGHKVIAAGGEAARGRGRGRRGAEAEGRVDRAARPTSLAHRERRLPLRRRLHPRRHRRGVDPVRVRVADARSRRDLRLGGDRRLRARLDARSRLPVLHDRPDARRPRQARGDLAGDQGGHALDRRLPARPLRLDGPVPLRHLAAAAEDRHLRPLAHDASA